MPLKLPVPNSKLDMNLNLPTEDDPEQAATCGFRQATYGEQEALADIDAATVTEYDDKGFVARTINRSNWFSIRRRQCQLTMIACNIEDPEESKPLFSFRHIDGKLRVDMTDDEFAKAWGKLPSKWAAAIIEKMLVINPQWRFDAKK